MASEKASFGLFGKADEEPQGYFHVVGAGLCPLPTLSVESGEMILARLTDRIPLTSAEAEDIRNQLRSAGLPKKMSDAEREMWKAADREEDPLRAIVSIVRSLII